MTKIRGHNTEPLDSAELRRLTRGLDSPWWYVHEALRCPESIVMLIGIGVCLGHLVIVVSFGMGWFG